MTSHTARMKNPAMVLPDAMKGIQSIYKAMYQGGVPHRILELVHLRASQINGCSACVFAGVTGAKKAGETDERLHAVAAWREAPFFDEEERAALELTEAATRIADRSGQAVPDAVWDAAADHFNEEQLSAIILMIGLTNFFNRINATVQEPAGATWS
ncbi:MULTISPECIES: carboxymuconolactone decarboxylase family protein [Streptomycetaceae]|uniref:Carboxymuconolactone decarboxylase family protein n=1 Tax=Kitasatospora purpeofusca TaxID=67352 RepID=A0ABZ1U299_9ACTN|nr:MULTISPECIES: carboxymuconolactone decarboxylase family protein [Streptomycetaceae]WTA52645.1 carboxymuconolactone decarboxylase family protein [Kitasatospora purpeofusca]BEK66884.1 carboxymuconolactone decarboxylase family protein [Kitasatospora purpeofusca]